MIPFFVAQHDIVLATSARGQTGCVSSHQDDEWMQGYILFQRAVLAPRLRPDFLHQFEIQPSLHTYVHIF